MQLLELAQSLCVDLLNESSRVHEKRLTDFERKALDICLHSHQVRVIVQNILDVCFFEKLKLSDFSCALESTLSINIYCESSLWFFGRIN